MLKRPKPRDPEVIAEARRLAQVGTERETILLFLRDRGFDKIDSSDTIQEIYGLFLAEARDLVHRSAAWSDRFHCDNKLRETAMRVLRDLAAESANDPDAPKITFKEPEDSQDPHG